MRNLKKVLALVVALTFVLSTVAFAAPTSDIDNDNVKEAVERLYYFGIVNGKDDGLYHPEENLTREQFAKLVVEAMGLGAAAEASGGNTGFPDVAADRWSAGYIQVASGKGIIKGNPDGTFAPEAGVTYPEAVTMLVRALGYKDEFLVGAWPSNYVAKAAELDIPLGAKYSVNGVVDRGAAAVLVNNTLDANVITQTTFGDENNWEESDDTLLDTKLDLTKVEDCTVTDTAFVDDSLDVDEVTIDCDTNAFDGDYTLLNQPADGLLGMDCNLYLNSDDEIVYLDVTTDEDDILVGYVTDEDEITIDLADGSDDDYDLATDEDDDPDYILYEDNALVEDADENDIDNDQYGTFILNDDGDIAFAVVYTIDDVVTVVDVDEEDAEIEGRSDDNDDLTIDLGDEDGYKIFFNGAEIAIEDVMENDVVAAAYDVTEVDGDTYNYAFVVRKSLEGELTKAKDDKVYIDDDSYNVDNTASFSLDQGDGTSEYTGAVDVKDAIGETVTVYLDLKGDVSYMVTDVDVTSDTIYGIVTKENEITMDTVKVFNGEGETVTYTFDEDVDDDDQAILEGDIVEFELSSDGTIDYEESGNDDYSVIATGLDPDDLDNGIESGVVSFDDDDDSITVDDTGLVGDDTYYVTDDTVLMTLYDSDDNVDPEVVEWDLIEDKDIDDDLRAVLVLDDNDLDIDFIVFTDNYDLSGDITTGYLADSPYYDGDDWIVDVVEYDGSEASYILDSADEDELDEGDFVVFNKTDSGDMNDVSVTVRDNTYATVLHGDIDEDDWDITTGVVTEISGSVIELDNDDTFKVLSNTGIFTIVLDGDGLYDVIEESNLSDIDEGDMVQIVEDDDPDVKMVIIWDNSEDEVDGAVEVDAEIYDNDDEN